MTWLNADQINTYYYPNVKGSYFLVLELKEVRKIWIPRFGEIHLQSGIFGYSGSALGPGGIRARLKHHIREIQKPHWHIDWLRPELDWVGIYFQAGTIPWECTWIHKLHEETDAAFPIPGFGASDCTYRCVSHLLYCPTKKVLSRWVDVLDNTTGGSKEIEYNDED
jgi:Uri superfamily endonuclease